MNGAAFERLRPTAVGLNGSADQGTSDRHHCHVRSSNEPHCGHGLLFEAQELVKSF